MTEEAAIIVATFVSRRSSATMFSIERRHLGDVHSTFSECGTGSPMIGHITSHRFDNSSTRERHHVIRALHTDAAGDLYRCARLASSLTLAEIDVDNHSPTIAPVDEDMSRRTLSARWAFGLPGSRRLKRRQNNRRLQADNGLLPCADGRGGEPGRRSRFFELTCATCGCSISADSVSMNDHRTLVRVNRRACRRLTEQTRQIPNTYYALPASYRRASFIAAFVCGIAGAWRHPPTATTPGRLLSATQPHGRLRRGKPTDLQLHDCAPVGKALRGGRLSPDTNRRMTYDEADLTNHDLNRRDAASAVARPVTGGPRPRALRRTRANGATADLRHGRPDYWRRLRQGLLKLEPVAPGWCATGAAPWTIIFTVTEHEPYVASPPTHPSAAHCERLSGARLSGDPPRCFYRLNLPGKPDMASATVH